MLLDIQIAHKAITTTNEVLGMYMEVLDRAAPWKAFNQSLTELDAYRKDYSTESAWMLRDIRSLMDNGIDSYYHASKYILEWCDTAIPLLTSYVDLFRNDHTVEKAHTQKDLLVEVLAKGIKEMSSAQEEILEGSNSFNRAVGQLTRLNSRIQLEFDEKSVYYQSTINNVRIGAYSGTGFFGLFSLGVTAAFVELKFIPEVKAKMAKIQKSYDKLTLKVDQALRDVQITKHKLNREVLEIGDLKSETESTKTFVDLDFLPDLRDTLIESGQSLIDKCKEYRLKQAKI